MIDPIKEIARIDAQEKALAADDREGLRTVRKLLDKCEVASDAVSYEIPLVPPAGAKLVNLTCASTYRAPIPVRFDPVSRTCYPTLKD